MFQWRPEHCDNAKSQHSMSSGFSYMRRVSAVQTKGCFSFLVCNGVSQPG
jgi:hypothetical protein